ncbi:MAG: beta-lactamase family protein [Proteobacteria bacterium]|nr:beta-lactamase family protein [Pseudomonadota bacterium]
MLLAKYAQSSEAAPMWLLTYLACTGVPDTSDTLVTINEGFDSRLAFNLDKAFDEAFDETNMPGATLAVYVPDEGTWAAARGYANYDEGIAAETDSRFGVGSITKTFVSSVILQLETEGELSIDDKVTAWLPEETQWNMVTLRDLLGHTSGIDDFIDELDLVVDLSRYWTGDELVALVANKPLLFKPGTDYEYSNTNYVLLGVIIERVTLNYWRDEVRTRLIEPLNLDRTHLPGDGEYIEDWIVHGYIGSQGIFLDVSESSHPSTAGAAGEMVSCTEDLLTWMAALYGGEVLEPEQLQAMTTEESPRMGYGLGCDIETRSGERLLGHGGASMGYQARMHWSDDSGMATATLVNNFFVEADIIDDPAWSTIIGY